MCKDMGTGYMCISFLGLPRLRGRELMDWDGCRKISLLWVILSLEWTLVTLRRHSLLWIHIPSLGVICC
jgi:hypothetical protein